MADDAYLRLPQIVNNPKAGTRGLLGISRSFFLDQVKKGRFPAATKLSPRVSVWKKSQILALIAEK